MYALYQRLGTTEPFRLIATNADKATLAKLGLRSPTGEYDILPWTGLAAPPPILFVPASESLAC